MFYLHADDGLLDYHATGVQTWALPASRTHGIRHHLFISDRWWGMPYPEQFLLGNLECVYGPDQACSGLVERGKQVRGPLARIKEIGRASCRERAGMASVVVVIVNHKLR